MAILGDDADVAGEDYRKTESKVINLIISWTFPTEFSIYLAR